MINSLLKDLQKLRDFNINTIPNQELVNYYQTWINQINDKKITDEKLWHYIENQITYWIAKDKQYSNFLKQLLEEYLTNATN